MARLVQTLQGVNMRDIIVKTRFTYKGIVVGEDGTAVEVDKSLDELLPIDRVVTVDGNGYMYLYDTCIVVTEDMIEKEL